MEWFWQMIDHFQKSAAGAVLQSFSVFDWVVAVSVLLSLLHGIRKGFGEMFGKLLGIFLVSMLTMSLYRKAASYLAANIPVLPLEIAQPFAFFLLTVFFWITVSWGVNIFGKIFKVEAHGILKVLGGGIFGALRMILLLSFLAQMLLFLPIKPVQQILEPGHTATGSTIARVVPDLHKLITKSFRRPSHEKFVRSYKTGE